MEKETRSHCLWVDWKRRVISFRRAAGFEKTEFSSHEEMLAFAIEKGYAGFGIQ